MTQIEPGVYPNATFEEYINWPCFHKSMVGPALRSTAHLKHYIDSEKHSSKVMDFGSLVDCLILEAGIFGTKFIEIPAEGEDAKGNPKPWSNQLKFCKAWTAEQKEKGLTPYSVADYDKAIFMLKIIDYHKTAGAWLADGEKQVAIVWKDSETGILCKSRIDNLRDDRIIDLKTTGNASPSEFKRTCNNFLYHVQALQNLS